MTRSLLLLLALLLPVSTTAELTPQQLDAKIDSVFNSAGEDIEAAIDGLRGLRTETSNPGPVDGLIGALYFRAANADSARAALQRAVEGRPDLAGPRLGLGRVELELAEDPRAAIPHFEQALSIDSTYADAYAQMAVAFAERGEAAEARRHADRAISLNSRLPAPYRILGEYYAEEENTKVAILYYRRYLNLSPGDQETAYAFALKLHEAEAWDDLRDITSRMRDTRGLPLLGVALIETGMHETALSTFQKYVGTLDKEHQRIYEDIALVGNQREVRAWRSIADDARETFLKRFWLERDPFKTSGGAMRRSEHYRRVWEANRLYGEKQFPWDKRGDVYVRYGKPQWKSTSRDLNAIIPPAVRLVQQHSAQSLYGSRGVDFSFVGPVYPIKSQQSGLGTNPLNDDGLVGFDNFKPITTGADASSVPWEVWIYADITPKGLEIAFTDDFNSGRFDYAPIPMLSEADMDRLQSVGRSPVAVISTLTDYSPQTLVQRATAKEPDRYDMSELTPLTFFYEAVSFRGEETGKNDLQINIGLPIDNVALPSDPDTTVLVERRVVLLQNRATEVGRSVEQLGVTINDANRDQGLLAVERVDMGVAPGRYELRVQAGRLNTKLVQVYPHALILTDYTRPELQLSDLQIAQHVVEIFDSTPATRFRRGNFEIQPAPARQFRQSDAMYVYYEVYNLKRDEFGQTRYKISYEVETQREKGKFKIPFLAKLRRKRAETIGFEFEQTGSDETEKTYLELDLAEAKPGEYEVRLKIDDLNAQTETIREATFTVIE